MLEFRTFFSALRMNEIAREILPVNLEEEMRQADDFAVGILTEDEQRQLVKLLEGVRAGQRRGNAPILDELADDRPAAAPID